MGASEAHPGLLLDRWPVAADDGLPDFRDLVKKERAGGRERRFSLCDVHLRWRVLRGLAPGEPGRLGAQERYDLLDRAGGDARADRREPRGQEVEVWEARNGRIDLRPNLADPYLSASRDERPGDAEIGRARAAQAGGVPRVEVLHLVPAEEHEPHFVGVGHHAAIDPGAVLGAAAPHPAALHCPAAIDCSPFARGSESAAVGVHWVAEHFAREVRREEARKRGGCRGDVDAPAGGAIRLRHFLYHPQHREDIDFRPAIHGRDGHPEHARRPERRHYGIGKPALSLILVGVGAKEGRKFARGCDERVFHAQPPGGSVRWPSAVFRR